MAVYSVNTSNRFSDEQQRRFWQIIIPWLIKSAARYEIVCETTKNGSERIIPWLSKQAEIKEARYSKSKTKIINVLLKGKTDKNLEEILLSGPLPDNSIPADISPCREILFYRNDNLLYSCYDYGVFQTLYLCNQEEAQAFLDILKNAGIPQDILEKQ